MQLEYSTQSVTSPKKCRVKKTNLNTMNPLRNLRDIQSHIGTPLIFPAEPIPLSKVSAFAEITGDKNDHNAATTEKFARPAVQGFLSLALFANFHKRICKIDNADPINVRIIDAKFLRPVYADEPVITKLTIKSVESLPTHLMVIWKYELLNTESKRLVFAEIELRYYFNLNP
jgi:acyl dehydratase